MTNKEAIKNLKKLLNLCDFTDELDDRIDCEPYYEAVDLAIKALEQEPCEDCVSRKAIKEKKVYSKERHEYIVPVAEIDWLPSVTPKFTDSEIQKMQELEQAQLEKAYELENAEMHLSEDCISRTELLARIDEIIEELPSVTPKFTDDEIQKMQELEQAQLDKAYELGKAEMQPCDDTISKKDVMAIIEWAYDECKIDGYTDYCEIRDMVKELPSVTPQESEDYISRQEVIDIINFEDKWLHDAGGHNANTKIAFSGLKSRVKALTSVTPEAESEAK